jgi:hypothetical protein
MMPSHYPLSDYDKGELREEGFMRKIEWSEHNGMDAYTRKNSREKVFFFGIRKYPSYCCRILLPYSEQLNN